MALAAWDEERITQHLEANSAKQDESPLNQTNVPS